MPITVSIEYEQNVNSGEQIILEAVVRDSATNVVIDPSLVTYTWSLESPIGQLRPDLVPSLYENQIVYTATGTGITPETAQNVGITCQVELPNRIPIITGTVDFDTFDDVGVTGLNANMLININVPSSDATAWFTRDDANAFQTGSNRSLDINLNVGWVTYNPDTGIFTIYREQLPNAESMITYWGIPGTPNTNATRKVPFLVLGDGTVIQFETAWYSGLTNSAISWQIDDNDIPTLEDMARVTNYPFVLLGIGDSSSTIGVTETASQTVIVSIQGTLNTASATFSRKFIRPILDKINVGFLNRLIDNTGYNNLEGVDNKPRSAYGKVSFNVPPYDESIRQQRYRPVKITVPLSSRIDGVSEFTDINYIVILQPIGDAVTGERGRSFHVYGVYDKTETTFSISYEEGATRAAFGTMFQSFNVEMLWFARGK